MCVSNIIAYYSKGVCVCVCVCVCVWNSWGGWKKYQKLIVGGRGWLFSFSNHENYSIENICVYSKSKTETKNKI